MELFRIIIKNASSYEIYNSLISANNENEALQIALKENLFTLFDGDTLTITNFENE